MRIVAIDYGLKRVGIAISDELKITCRPLQTIFNDDNFKDKVKNLLNEYNIEKIIIGLPDKSSNNEKLIKNINEFSEYLSVDLSYNIELVDESFSSKRASQIMIESGKSKKFRKEKTNLDAFAASIILRDYLERLN